MKNDNKKSNTKTRRIWFSIGMKVGLLVLISMILCFGVSLLSSILSHLAAVTSSRINSDYNTGRVIAETLDQAYVSAFYHKSSDIYNSIPEEKRLAQSSEDYLNSFSVITDDNYYELKSKLTTLAYECGLKWIDMRLIDTDNERFIYLLDTRYPDNGGFAPGSWEKIGDAAMTYTMLSEEDSEDSEDGSEEVSAEASEEVPASDESESGDYQMVDFSIAPIQDLLDSSEHTLCTYAPFYDDKTGEEIGYLGIGIDVELFYNDMRQTAELFIAIILIFTGAILFISFLMTSIMISKPVKRLTKAAREYAHIEDKLHSKPVFANVKVRTHDEIRVLSESLRDMETDLTAYMNELTAITAEHERAAAELELAKKIQSDMLPNASEDPGQGNGFSISAYMEPAKEVGGDFYDYFKIDEDHIGLAIADVSGKGVPAALFMAISMTLLRNAAMEHKSPVKAIGQLNLQLTLRNTEMMFVTVWFGIYTISQHTLSYVNAGHEYPALYRKASDSYEYIREEHDVVCGLVADSVYTEHEISLSPGDRFFIYTDGVTEAMSETDELFGEERLLASLNSDTSLSGRDLLSHTAENAREFMADCPQSDDITMLLLEIDPE